MPQDSNTTSATKTRRPGKIIAVGGAKGGIGKSLFVANLGVLLSQLGKRTVVVDLDLGGSNLHLYMGVWSLSRRIDDYLEKKVATISEIITPTKFGPQLIGGGGGKLGAANIHFSRKIKLLRSLKTIDADYVILDLGGDTTFNILDFYLAADQGFVLTTCEPASYLDAYGFLKMSLHRRLTRLFGADSEHYRHRDGDVEGIIRDHIFTTGTNNGQHMTQLIDRLKQAKPVHHDLVKRAIDEFRPGAVVTMFESQEQVAELVNRLQKVSRKMLSVDLNYFGAVPYDRAIQKSAQELVPCVAKDPAGIFAKTLRRIVLKMEMA